MVSMSIGHNIIQLDNQQLDHVYYQNAHQCLTSSNRITSVERPKDKHINGVLKWKIAQKTWNTKLLLKIYASQG